MYFGFEAFRSSFGSPSLSTYKLGVYSFSPDCFYNRTKISEDDFILDIVDLSYYTAKTICSYHLTKRELYFDVVASVLSHLNFIDTTHNNFLLSESRYIRLRDFSKNTRIGEMAQGINALFVARKLDFPYIIDFDLAKQKTNHTLNISSTGKTPDFVVLNKEMNKIGLFESKGTMHGKVTGKSGRLSDAMEQIDSVENPCFNYSLPVCTKFENNNDENGSDIPQDRKSTINYSQIPNSCTNNYNDISILIKLHYASWFYLVGDFGRVNSILENGTIQPFSDNDNSIYILDTDTDKNNPIYWVNKDLINEFFLKDYGISLIVYAHLFHENNFKIGIYKKVIDNLISSNLEGFNLPEGEIEFLKKYPDGTLIFLNTEVR